MARDIETRAYFNGQCIGSFDDRDDAVKALKECAPFAAMEIQQPTHHPDLDQAVVVYLADGGRYTANMGLIESYPKEVPPTPQGWDKV